jgi:hypothetical protein
LHDGSSGLTLCGKTRTIEETSMSRASFLLLLPALAACTPPAGITGVDTVRVISAAETAGCEATEVVSMTPGLYGPVIGDQAVEYARNEVLALAARGGANAFVFDETPLGEPVYLVRGTGYRC